MLLNYCRFYWKCWRPKPIKYPGPACSNPLLFFGEPPMSFVATETVDFEPLSAGDYLARCVTVAYLGLQHNKLEPTKNGKSLQDNKS